VPLVQGILNVTCPRCKTVFSYGLEKETVAETSKAKWPPVSDMTFQPTGMVDLKNERDAKALQNLLNSELLCQTADIYPSVCRIKSQYGEKTLLFSKFPKDVFEDIKESPATAYVASCVLTNAGPVISLQVEYVSPQFLRNLVRLIGELRTKRLGSLTVCPPESLNVEIFLNPHSLSERQDIMQLENQDMWFHVLAANDFTTFRSLSTPGNQKIGLRNARLFADEYIQKVRSDTLNFQEALKQFHDQKVPLRSFIFQSFPGYIENGIISIQSGREFEERITERLYTLLGLDISQWY